MKKYFIGFILGAIIFSGITVSAYTILANNIGYAPSDSTWKKTNGEDITNVKDAIDELYSKATKKPNLGDEIGWTQYNSSGWASGTTAINSISLELEKTYLVHILGGFENGNTSPPNVTTTFSGANCTKIATRIDYSSNKLLNNNYSFWFTELYKCIPTAQSINISSKTSNNNHIWFYTNAYEMTLD